MAITVMLVDDSNFMRKALRKLITSEHGFEVVAAVSNGKDAVEVLPKLKPDVVVLDVEMEGMDGLATLQRIMDVRPTPVIMFSAYTKKGADITLRSLQEGAVDFMEKPSGSISMDLNAVKEELLGKVRVAARVTPQKKVRIARSARREVKELQLPEPTKAIVAIGSSTGGVQALHSIIPKLPSTLQVPIVVVQHMPAIFTRSLASSLDEESVLTVKEGEESDALLPGRVYIAPGGKHMTVRSKADGRRYIHIDTRPEDEPLRPSVDVLFRSVASVYGENTLAIVLTGMGNDGTTGLKEVKAKNGLALTQTEASCVVYGMPRFAYESGCVDEVLPLSEMAEAICSILAREKNTI